MNNKKSGFKRFIAVFILFTLAVSFAVPMAVNAATRTGEMELHLIQEGDFTDFTEENEVVEPSRNGISLNAYYAPVIKNYEDLNKHEKTMYDIMMQVNEYIGFSVLDNITFEWGKKMLTGVINDFPELFYVSSSFTYVTQWWFGNDYITKLTPHYAMTNDEITYAKQVFNAGVDDALSYVDGSMNEAQRALVLHDYILSHAYYCEDGDYTHSAYGMFKNRKTVCAGYTLAYSYLLKQTGIDSQYMYSDSLAHCWNAVKIDGLWYQCDITWDDTSASYGTNEDAYGVVLHYYFLKSKDYMAANGHNEFLVRIDDLSTDNTKYDNAFWNNISCPIPVYKGEYYYIEPTSTSSVQVNVKVKKADKYFNVTQLLDSPQVCEVNGKYVAGQIAILDDKVFFSNAPAYYDPTLYCIIDNRNFKVMTLQAPLTGLIVKNNQLCYQLKSNTDFRTIDKVEAFNKAIKNKHTHFLDSKYNPYVDFNKDGIINAKDYVYLKRQLNI